MTFYPIRITDNEQFTQEELIQFTKNHPDMVLVLEYKNYNPDKGPHYHGYIETDKSSDVIRKWITQELHCVGNKDYSMKDKESKDYLELDNADYTHYYYYICKGNTKTKNEPPLVFFNISQEEVNGYSKQFWDNREIYKKLMKDEKEKVQEELDRHIREQISEISNYCDILELILQFYKKKDLRITNSQVESHYHYYMTKYDSNYISFRAMKIRDRL